MNIVYSKEIYRSVSTVFVSYFCRYYLAYAPRILRAGAVEKVMVTTYNVNFDVEVKATLRDARDSKKVIASGVAKVQPGRFHTYCPIFPFWLTKPSLVVLICLIATQVRTCKGHGALPPK